MVYIYSLPCTRPCAVLRRLGFEPYGFRDAKSKNQIPFNQYYGVKKKHPLSIEVRQQSFCEQFCIVSRKTQKSFFVLPIEFICLLIMYHCITGLSFKFFCLFRFVVIYLRIYVITYLCTSSRSNLFIDVLSPGSVRWTKTVSSPSAASCIIFCCAT